MKKKFFNWLILIVLSLILNECTLISPLESKNTPKNLCINANDNLNFDLQIYPELNGFYLSFVNLNNDSFKNLSLTVFFVNNTQNKIFSQKQINLSELTPNQIFCGFFPITDFLYNEDLGIFIMNLKYDFRGEEAYYYSTKVDQTFRVDQCLEVYRWNRYEELKYNQNILYRDKIIFKKICNDSFFLFFKFNESLDIPIQIQRAQLNYNSITEEAEISSAHSKEIGILLNEDLPLDKKISLDLEYVIRRSKNENDDKFMFAYPFSHWFYEFNTGNIIPEAAYLLFQDSSSMNLTSIGYYTTTIKMPLGFTNSKKPQELVYHREFNQEVLNETGNNDSISLVYPSFSCLNISSFPPACVAFVSERTPLPEATNQEISWTSPIINGNPRELSFRLVSNWKYRILLICLIIISIIIIIILIKSKEHFLEIILGYIVVLILSVADLLPIPGYFTLFESLLLLNILVILFISIFFYRFPKTRKIIVKNAKEIVIKGRSRIKI